MSYFPFVSIIIPTFNRVHLLSKTVNSFLLQNYPNNKYEIILSNNNSTDSTQQLIDEYCSRNNIVRSIPESRQGVHYARNSAAKIAQGDILYFTDDDMFADPGLIREITKVFEIDPKIGTATGKIIARFDAPPPAWVKKHLINRYLSLTDEDMPDEVIVSENDMVFSCHQAVKREVFFQCGGFNPENTSGVWIGDGETGLGIRMKQAGYLFAYTPKSVIYHLIPKNRTTFAYLLKRVGNQGNCDSYTDYRAHRNREKIIPGILRRCALEVPREIARTLLRTVSGHETWRMLPALMVYFHKRNVYDLKLYNNVAFRKLVEVDNWLSDDHSTPP